MSGQDPTTGSHNRESEALASEPLGHCNNMFVSGVSSILKTAQTWANAGVYSAFCAHAFGFMFVCLL